MKKKIIIEGFGIAVIDRGFVFVGTIKLDGNWYTMTDAKNIRKWGTSNGLGELAKKGPLENTKLDEYGTIRIPKKSMIFLIDTEESLWQK